MYDGGICASLRDLLPFGSLLLNEGVAPHGAQVLPPAWVADTWNGAPDSAAAFATSPTVTLMPGGMYRNQCWFPSEGRDVLLSLGIHGQMVYVNRSTGVVAAKLSAWPEPQNTWKLFSTLAAFDASVRRCPPEPRLATAESSSFRGVIETEDEPAETTGKLVQLLRCGVAPVPRGPEADPHLELAFADAQCEEPEPRRGR